MSANEEARKAICILSFDNGGPGTYSQLLILKEDMSRLANDSSIGEEDVYPADHFDVMGGVGFGGLVAILLEYLRMNVDEAIDALIAVATTVFPEDSENLTDLNANSRKLKNAIENMLQAGKIPVNTKMYEQSRPQTRCKVVLYAATSDNISHPQAFRTYPIRGSSLNPTIAEAICATMATPSYFLPVKIGRSQRRFVGAALSAHNPTRELLKEASTVFGNEKRVAQIISIGCGVPPVLSLEAMTNETGVSRLLKEIPADCQMVAMELAARLYSVDVYLRLSVEKGVGSIGMDQWTMLGNVEMHTACYIEQEALTKALEASLKRSQQSIGSVTLGRLNSNESYTWTQHIILAGVPHEEQWGLILDNADDPGLQLAPFLPKSVNLTIVVTSRNRNFGNLSTTYHVELGNMEPEEALAALLCAARRQLPLSGEETRSAHTLLKELGCLAVAVVQAGTYCHAISYSFTQYLSLFNSHRAELMKKAEPSSLDNYQRGAYTTLDLTYKIRPRTSRDFLHLISFFHHTDIPLSVLATAAREDFADPFRYLARSEGHASVLTSLRSLLCVDGNWSEMLVQEILRTLRSFSLLSISSIDDSILLQLHPLIQAWSRDMDSLDTQHHRAMVLQVLTACCGDEPFLLRPQIQPHILDMPGQLKTQHMHINDLMATGKILRALSHHRTAEGLFETALELIGKTPDNDKESFNTISAWLASVYQDEGKWGDAERLSVDVLNQRRRISGPEHIETIQAAANLAVVYHAQGRWSEAENLMFVCKEKEAQETRDLLIS